MRGLLRYDPASLFIAGVVATLVFFEGALTILHGIGFLPFAPFSIQPTQPFGVPQIWSTAFWGGVWGLVFGLAERYFPKGILYWLAAILFGAIVPSLGLWFIVLPLKGAPIGGGWSLRGTEIALMLHGAWGLGTAFFLAWHAPRR
jgi:hypothetical protein